MPVVIASDTHKTERGLQPITIKKSTQPLDSLPKKGSQIDYGGQNTESVNREDAQSTLTVGNVGADFAYKLSSKLPSIPNTSTKKSTSLHHRQRTSSAAGILIANSNSAVKQDIDKLEDALTVSRMKDFYRHGS